MKAFTQLYSRLDETNKTNEKTEALVRYFQSASPADSAWAIYFLSGQLPRRIISTTRLSEWATEASGIPFWLFRESYDAVGDIAETITLILPDTGESTEEPFHVWIEERLLPLARMSDDERKANILRAWRELSRQERFIWNKLLTGAFRVGVSRKLVTRALAQVSGIDEATIAHRLMGAWQPTASFYDSLMQKEAGDANLSAPYPFFLAYALESPPEEVLGDRHEWQVEWKWDGIRAQLIRRAGQTFLWTRGEELVSDRYPEIIAAAQSLPDGCVIDGEILPWKGERPLPFAQLQRRIGRKSVTNALLAQIPVILLAYDLLEHDAADVRALPLTERRARLETLVTAADTPALRLSQVLSEQDWGGLATAREESRERLVEGFMIKRLSSPYRVGRIRGDWWKWKISPYTVDAVMIYAQRGSGKRASLYTDYTFAVWNSEGQLVPFTKAYSGLTDSEIREVDSFVRRNTEEKFGPVRSVKPELVFELAFEGIQRSARHKSGIAVRFPRILRWRKDKKPDEADTLDVIEKMLPE